MRLWEKPIIPIFAVVIFVVVGISKINFNRIVDDHRHNRYTNSQSCGMTVGLVWPQPHGELEQRYSFQAGAQYALDQFKKDKRFSKICRRIRLKMINESGQQNDQMGRQITGALKDPSLTALLGFIFSTDVNRAAIMTAKREVFVLTPSATWPTLTKHGFDNLFRMVPDDSDSARMLANFVKSRGYKKIGMIYSMTLHGNAISPLLAEELEKQGVTVAFSHAYPPISSPTFTDVIDIIGPELKRNGDIDALFMIDSLDVNAQMLINLRKAGVKVPILGSDSLDFPSTWKEAGSAAEEICFISLKPFDDRDGKISGLYNAVVRKEDREKISLADFGIYDFMMGYETMTLYLSAVTKADSFYPHQLGIVLRNETWDTLKGQVQFSPDGDVIGSKVAVVEIKDGHPHVVFTDESK